MESSAWYRPHRSPSVHLSATAGGWLDLEDGTKFCRDFLEMEKWWRVLGELVVPADKVMEL